MLVFSLFCMFWRGLVVASCAVVSTNSLLAADVVSVVMNRKMFMVCRLVLCHAWDTKVLVVNFYTDLFV